MICTIIVYIADMVYIISNYYHSSVVYCHLFQVLFLIGNIHSSPSFVQFPNLFSVNFK